MFVVYCCGPTDCWPYAAFRFEKDANDWMNKHATNPEGGIVRFEPFDQLEKIFTEAE